MEEKRQGWTLYETNDEGTGPKLWQLRDSFPKHVGAATHPVAVIVEWQYGEDGLPDKETLTTLHQFEGLMRPLDSDGGNSVLVHIIRGSGMSELCHYAKDYDQFVSDLNRALSGQPRFPIEIEFMSDPQWEYRGSIAQSFAQ